MSEEKMESIAAGIRARRAMKRATQVDVAKSIGVNPSTLGSWESTGGIRFEDAWKLADYYSCSLDELAGRDAR